jgi:hypothetical protein
LATTVKLTLSTTLTTIQNRHPLPAQPLPPPPRPPNTMMPDSSLKRPRSRPSASLMATYCVPARFARWSPLVVLRADKAGGPGTTSVPGPSMRPLSILLVGQPLVFGFAFRRALGLFGNLLHLLLGLLDLLLGALH